MIAGPRLFLRPVTLADVGQAYVDWLNDPVVNRYLETRFERQTLATVTAYVTAMRDRCEEPFLAIFEGEGGRHVGNIKLGPVNAHHRLADVSLLIGARDCWGRGYATEAITLVVGHAFDVLHLAKLSAGFYAPNTASIRAFEKSGFKIEGVRRRHYRLDDSMCDIVLMGLCRDEWRGGAGIEG